MSAYAVVCDDYRYECKTLEAAERRLAAIENGGVCRLAHRIEGPLEDVDEEWTEPLRDPQRDADYDYAYSRGEL